MWYLQKGKDGKSGLSRVAATSAIIRRYMEEYHNELHW
jgi:hypothetical protein